MRNVLIKCNQQLKCYFYICETNYKVTKIRFYRVSHKFVYRFQIALTLELLNRFKPNLGSM